MELNALFLNCTLKKSPQESNTEALIELVRGHFDELDVESEVIRPVDYNIPFGVVSDMGEGDEWPRILEKIKAADILVVGMSIWFGVRSSVAQLVIERLDGTYEETNEAGRTRCTTRSAGWW
jgi:multimeric flavodoxin WrbA